MKPKHRRVFIGVFLIIVPPVLMVLSAARSVDAERHVRDGRIESMPVWSTIFPLAMVATFIGIPLGAFLIYRALSSPPTGR